MADTGKTHMVLQSFESIELIDENVHLIDDDIHDILVHDEAENVRLSDDDVHDTFVHDEVEADDHDGVSRCDDDVTTPREDKAYGNFEDFDSEHMNGKVFNTQEAAYEFYNQYALLNGFGTCKHNAHKIMATGAIFKRQFVCNKQGFKKLDGKRLNGNEKRRRDLRTGCEAMMQFTLSKKLGVWVVDKFQDVHNHPLTTTPSKVIKHRSHSKYHRTNVCKSLVSDLNNEGLIPSQITRVVNVMKPSEEADVTPRQSHVAWTKSQTIEDFEARWKDLNEKYDLKGNSWIQNMYNLLAHWAKSFPKDTFFAGMTTSGRSESIHSFFDGYVNSNTILNEFVLKYDKVVYSRRYDEEDEDFKTMNSKAILSSDHLIEAKAGECYTRSMFEIFKKGWNASVGCSHITLSKEPYFTKYKVGLITVDKEKWRTVYCDSSKNVKLSCFCAKFETAGILCKHILYVLKKNKMTNLPKYYILPRWTIHARYKVGDVGNRMDEISRHSTENGVSLLTLWSLRAKFSKAIENGRNSPSEICEIYSWLTSFLEKQAARKDENKLAGGEMVSQVGLSTCISQVEGMNQISIRDPNTPIKTKGRPKVATRLKFSIELAKEENKQRTCAYCHGKGHYRTGCAKRKKDEGKCNFVQ
ncbi:hypothetical protein RJ640_015918 [Escallonia rubra]|uniref:SWIM-type domain-containing protein n=1 Tax=Escallonia rubra TaxID=112253 RepID=A0AA88UF53_9ASTE|nr:hypothetical protein RJ640_015918 [Escallonia rubra]